MSRVPTFGKFMLLFISTIGMRSLVEAQSGQPAFEAASIKLTGPAPPGGGDGVSPGRYTIRNRNIGYLIKDAFVIRNYQVGGAPAWLELDNYDIEAKASYVATYREMKVMLQTLLADRFHLKFHLATTELEGCVLAVAKGGPKFREYAGPPETDPRKAGIFESRGMLKGHTVSMAALVDYITDFLQVPVIDETHLAGSYDISLQHFTEVKLPDDPELIPESLPSALGSQLGLRLTMRKIPVEMLVVDHIERPTAN